MMTLTSQGGIVGAHACLIYNVSGAPMDFNKGSGPGSSLTLLFKLAECVCQKHYSAAGPVRHHLFSGVCKGSTLPAPSGAQLSSSCVPPDHKLEPASTPARSGMYSHFQA